MRRYNATYQTIADEFAIAHGDGKWIGAHYMGHLHEPILPGTNYAPVWLAFEPIEYGEIQIVGKFHYILINEEELILYSNIFGVGDKILQLDSYTIRCRQKFLDK